MIEDLEPLSREANQLLGWERQREGAGPHDQARVLERLVSANAFAAGTVPAGAAAAAGKATLVKVIVAAVLGTAVGGGTVGVVMSRELDKARSELRASELALAAKPAAVEQPQVPVPRPEPEPAPTPTEPAPVELPRPRTAKAVAPPEPAAVPREPEPSTTLRDESALIEQARTALLKNDLANAEAALNTHRSRFPSGHLVEEQELLSIQVLLAGHRELEARAAAERFRRAHPGSPLIPALGVLFDHDL